MPAAASVAVICTEPGAVPVAFPARSTVAHPHCIGMMPGAEVHAPPVQTNVSHV
jgi:hypothetical protein